MANPSYLQDLTGRLADGIARLPPEFRARHIDFVRDAQNSDGGFPGRQGGSDLYYTGFALRSLLVLDALTPEICERVTPFLRHTLTQQASVVDFFSFLYACILVQAAGGPDVLAGSAADWPERVANTLETFRTPDGGYAKSAGSSSGSTYHTFLVGLCCELLGRSVPRPDELVAFIQSRQREDGGYVEIAPMRKSGTNPTAAAVGILQLLSHDRNSFSRDPKGSAPPNVVDFLASMPSTEGGFRANSRAPFADLLSTFTGAWTLDQLGARNRIDAAAVARFVRRLELPTGGFKAGLWDDRADVEYTFYGLGVLALLV